MNTASTASKARDAQDRARGCASARRSAKPPRHAERLAELREDFRRLADQVAEIVADRGNAAWQRAKSSVDEVVADAQDKGRDAASAMREVSDHFVEAIDESIKTRPYTTLALVAGIAFLFGATWRR